MATDATGTPTSPDNIPTFNTSVDAPSGNGSNAQMAAIQTALTARTALLASKVDNPAGKGAGDVPVWNGATWVIPSGSRTGTKFLRDDGSWAVPFGRAVLYRSAGNSSALVGGSSNTINTEMCGGAAITLPANTFTSPSGVVRFKFYAVVFNNTGSTNGVIFSTGGFSTTVSWASSATAERALLISGQYILGNGTLSACNAGLTAVAQGSGLVAQTIPVDGTSIANQGAVALGDLTTNLTMHFQITGTAANANISYNVYHAEVVAEA